MKENIAIRDKFNKVAEKYGFTLTDFWVNNLRFEFEIGKTWGVYQLAKNDFKLPCAFLVKDISTTNNHLIEILEYLKDEGKFKQ